MARYRMSGKHFGARLTGNIIASRLRFELYGQGVSNQCDHGPFQLWLFQRLGLRCRLLLPGRDHGIRQDRRRNSAYEMNGYVFKQWGMLLAYAAVGLSAIHAMPRQAPPGRRHPAPAQAHL